MIKQSDIAEITHTSVPTVSRILAGKGRSLGVPDETISLVEITAKKLGYRVNLTARALRTRKHLSIGLLFNTTIEPLYAELVPSIQSFLFRKGYATICGFWNDNINAVKSINGVLAQGIDGVITCHTPEAFPTDIPAVFFATKAQGRDSVLINGQESLCDMIDYAISLGHTHIAFFDITYGNGVAEHVLKYESHGVKITCFPIEYHKFDNASSGGLITAIERLLSIPNSDRPTMLMCRNDRVAMRVISLLASKGFCIPRDFSVTGFDDTLMGRWASPPLTSSGIPVEQLADTLVNTLLRRLNNPSVPPREIILKRVLNARASTEKRMEL